MQMTKLALVVVGSALAIVCACAIVPARHSPVGVVHDRQAQMRRMAVAMKATVDGLRAAEPDLDALQANARTFDQLSQQLPSWFPAGSGPESGVTSHAKADIWRNADGFAGQAGAFRAAAHDLAGADSIDTIRTQFRLMASRCGSCHTMFREPLREGESTTAPSTN